MEGVVHDGWLVKSPPEKRIVKPKWRQRWFVLRHSGLLPGQFILEYFTDNTCKKLKGKIDLDQCEQIDAGLPVNSKIASYRHMFDIRTPKRTYYLLAETEAEMNKWVECICSVCGLKIHTEEDFLMPQEPSSTVITSSNLTAVKSSSNPYIPISECHTGKPVLNGNFSSLDAFVPLNASQLLNTSENGCLDLPKDPPPPPPKNDWQTMSNPISDEFYDHPKPLHHHSDSNTITSDADTDDQTYQVPASSRPAASPHSDVFNTLPPRVNWKTYPEDAFLPLNSTLPRRKSSTNSDANSVYDVVPSYHGSIREIKPQQKKVQSLASHFESMTVKTPPHLSDGIGKENRFQESVSEYVNQVPVPPRPPKPSKLRERHQYENFEIPHPMHEKDDNSYDVPPPTKGLVPKVSLTPLAGSNEPEENALVRPPSLKEATMDDTYDFPKFRGEDNINFPVPPPPQSTSASQKNRRHAYTNAPPGLFNSKDLIFNYEYRPSLMASDGYASGDCGKSVQSSSDAATPPSPSAIGAYANIPTSPLLASTFQIEAPPAVNRELKPKRVLSNEDKGSFSFLTLQPPPVCRSRTKADKRSFRKPRAAPSPTPGSSVNTMPPVPNRFRHHPEMLATSDDEISNSSGSRRNSSNDDQGRSMFASASKRDEIQYLDLDLDSEPSPSPKTPDRLSASTVYKKVDFVKTKAFNEMRQNVEETYRKSQ